MVQFNLLYNYSIFEKRCFENLAMTTHTINKELNNYSEELLSQNNETTKIKFMLALK